MNSAFSTQHSAFVEEAIAAATQIGAAKFDAIQAWLDGMGGDETPVSTALGRLHELEDVVLDPREDELNRDVLLAALLEGRAAVMGESQA